MWGDAASETIVSRFWAELCDKKYRAPTKSYWTLLNDFNCVIRRT